MQRFLVLLSLSWPYTGCITFTCFLQTYLFSSRVSNGVGIYGGINLNFNQLSTGLNGDGSTGTFDLQRNLFSSHDPNGENGDELNLYSNQITPDMNGDGSTETFDSQCSEMNLDMTYENLYRLEDSFD